MRKHHILIGIIAIILIGTIFLFYGGEKQVAEYPVLEDMDEFARSVIHDGQAIVSADFDESIIMSALIVKAELLDYEVTDEAYVIYHFKVVEDIKNDFGDQEVYVYEPKLSNGHLLYEPGTYVLVLSRTTDLYYQQPVCNNFNQVRIRLDEADRLVLGAVNAGEMDLIQDKDIGTYDALKQYIARVRSENTTIKDGIYTFEGRHILSEAYSDIIEGSAYMVMMTMTEVLYENRLLRECMFKVEETFKGEVEPYIIASIPTYLDVEVGSTYLAGLFSDGNYNLSGPNSLIAEEDRETMDAYITLLEAYEVVEEEEELPVEVVVKERDWFINPSYLPYYKINEDVVGWFKIEDTVIDYPILQGVDNDYYLHKDIEGNDSSEGCIIMDFRMDIQNMQNQTLVYGHNMKRGTMFHEITSYKNKDFYDAHPYIEFDTLYDDMLWEVFSVHVIDSNYTYILEYPLADDVEYQAYLDDIVERSMFISDVAVTTDDQILTLVTCSYEFDGARTIVHAKRIYNEPF